MKKYISSVISLTVICAVIAVLLALTNSLTKPIIDKNNELKANEALTEVLPGGEGFEKIDISKYNLPKTVIEAYSEKNGGHVVKLKTAGYGSGLVIMCGISKDNVITGAKCLESNETNNAEKTYGDSFKDKNAEEAAAVDTTAGSTKTTQAYKNAILDALNAVLIFGGAEVDVRTEEEILLDNLKEALPSAEGKFQELFITAELSDKDISRVFKAQNGSGYVLVKGEEFIAADNTNADVKAIEETVLTEISLEGKEISSQVEKAYSTNKDSFVFDIKAEGYGIRGEKYSKSGEHIKIRVAISNSGTILDIKTTYQKETEGLGDACAKEKFYGQFDGKNLGNFREIDAISGATITTNGYLNGVARAFDAFAVLKGGAN